MHYQTQLLSIGSSGQFLSATCHWPHQIGGEDTRQTGYAALALGRLDAQISLHDIARLAFPLLPASQKRVQFELTAARGQDELAASGNYDAYRSASYRENAAASRHAARLAGMDQVRVPRRVLASRNGRVVLGFEPTDTRTRGESLPGLLRLIDAETESVIGNWASSRFPVDGRGRGVERFFNVQLAHPEALSADGGEIVLRNDMQKPGTVVVCRLDEELTERGVVSFGRGGKMLAVTEGWLAISDTGIQRWTDQLKVSTKWALPEDACGWSAAATPDGALVVVSSFRNGELLLVDWKGGGPRRFAAHRGAQRDARADLAISDCGQWIASRCDRDVVVTRVADGVSWPAASLEDRVHFDPSYDGYVVRSHVPAAFGFVGSRLLVQDEAGVREVALEEPAGKAFVSEAGRAGARVPVQITPRMTFDELMAAAHLEDKADELHRLYSPAIAIQSTALDEAGWYSPGNPRAPELGASRFGGWPDLPEGMAWPTWQGRPMAFLGQFDLADIADVEPTARLPKSGLLSFFLGCSADTYEKYDDPRTRYQMDPMIGTAPNQGDGWRVLYTPAPANLRRLPYGASPVPELVEPHAVRFKRGGKPLPDEDTAIYAELPLDDMQRDNYNDLIAQLTPDPDEVDEQLMGYPRLIQSTPPELMCELAATGRNPWRFPEQGTPEAAELNQAASEWTLLLQLTSQTLLDWGDGGHFYFYGDRRAMERGDFSKIWVNFET